MTKEVPLVVATHNPGKVREFARLLRGHPWRLLTADEAGVVEEIPEPGPGYADNAAAKAQQVCAATGLCAIADDSGIEVLALRGWPGPASHRWRAGTDEDRVAGLLAEVDAQAPDDRRARYVAVVAFCAPGGEVVRAHGSCAGTLVAPRGTNGFGYDPIFLSDDLGITFGEADDAAKDSCSHRARALRRLAGSGVLDWSAGQL